VKTLVPDVSIAVEMLRRVLDHPLPHVVVLDGEHRNGLEPSPPQRDNEGVTIFQDFWKPSMFLDPELDKTDLILSGLVSSLSNIYFLCH
jgi:hypothetical protein